MKPAYRISANGGDISGQIGQNLESLRLTDKDGMEADQLDISITDPLHKIALPKPGATLSLALGWEDAAGRKALVDKGTFVVDEVGEDGGSVDTIVVVARSADFRDSLKQSRDASYNATTLGGILTTIAARNGLVPAIHPDLAATVVQHLSQTGESDANLVTRLGDDYGAVATIKSGRLLFVPWGKGLTASGAGLGGVTITRRDGDSHSFRTSERDGSQTGIQAKWIDTKSASTNFALAGKEGSVKTLKKTYPTQAEAQAAADAAWNRQKSKSHSFSHSLAVGDAAICACSPLTLVGFRREITAINWLLGPVTHTLNSSGFTTSYEATEIVGND